MTAKAPRGRKRPRVWIPLAGLGVLALVTSLAQIPGGHLGATWLAEKLREPPFQLRSVEFLGLEKLSGPALVKLGELVAGTPLIDLDVPQLLRRISRHPRVQRCAALRWPPDRLLLEIEERVPVARLEASDEGIALDGSRFPLLPDEAARLASLRGEAAWALPLLRAAQTQGIELATVEVRARDDLRFQPTGLDIEVRVGPDPALSLRDWRRLRGSSLLKGYRAGRVDLRFQGSALLTDFKTTAEGEPDGPS